MNLGVVVAEDVGVDLAEDVEVHADMSKTWTTLREILEAMMDSLEVTTGVLRMVNQENHLKDMVGAGLVLLSEEVAKVVSAMEKLLKENVLGGFLTVTVVLEEGQYSSLLLASMKAHSFHFFFYRYFGIPYSDCIVAGLRNELKREGSGRGNWGTPADEIAQ